MSTKYYCDSQSDHRCQFPHDDCFSLRLRTAACGHKAVIELQSTVNVDRKRNYLNYDYCWLWVNELPWATNRLQFVFQNAAMGTNASESGSRETHRREVNLHHGLLQQETRLSTSPSKGSRISGKQAPSAGAKGLDRLLFERLLFYVKLWSAKPTDFQKFTQCPCVRCL